MKPAEVEVLDFLRQGDWIVVGATAPVADGESYFFFQKSGDKLRFQDVWGGFAEASEAAEVAGWATALRAPASLSTCFASKAVSG